NVNFSDPSSTHANSISDLFLSYSCHNVVHFDTRHTPASSALLDPIFTNICLSDMLSSVISDTISDHLPTVLCIKKFKRLKTTPNEKTYRRFDRVSCEKFYQSMINFDWSPLYAFTDPNEAYNYFLKIYTLNYNL